VTERELIIQALNILRECVINISKGRGEYNNELVLDINECILELESLPEKDSPPC